MRREGARHVAELLVGAGYSVRVSYDGPLGYIVTVSLRNGKVTRLTTRTAADTYLKEHLRERP